jgi:hypothetical protein
LRTELRRALRVSAWLLPVALLHIGGSVAGQQADTPGRQVGISLAPSVVMLAGQPGQAYRQTLRLTNHTSRELAFRLEAQDVVADNGRRVFVAAGERSGSIAATAVFSPKEIVIAPGAVGMADVTLTLPPGTAVRGVAAIFRGQTIVGSQRGIAMTASLGCLITFTLSNDIRLEATAPEVSDQTNTSNLAVTEWVTNAGSEPVVASGAAALLNDAGVLVGKVPVEPQRLMPGERLAFRADYPAFLTPGRYRALLSLEYDDHERKVLTRTADFAVPSVRVDRRDADRSADVRP